MSLKHNRLLDFHRPKVAATASQLPVLTVDSKRCLRNLAAYTAPRQRLALPRSRLAAVLVALFVGRKGDLYVLLSRRSASLRTYAGDTSLPGGKVDPEDKSIEDAARREAFEEVGLPRDKQKVPVLCVLEPFLAAELIVIPIVVLILDKTMTPILNSAEVATLFSHPLASFLTTTPPFPTELEAPYHTYYDVETKGPPHSGSKHTLRVHQFLTGREAGGIKPVFGLTAAVMIRVATIGYGREPDFEVESPSGELMTTERRIAWALLSREGFQEACEREKVDLAVAKQIVVGWQLAFSRRRRRSRKRDDQKPRVKL